MKARRLIFAGTFAAGACALLARPRDPAVSMHELDWLPGGGAARRRYRSLGHVLHHLRELAGLAVPIFEVYLLRALSPAFREQVMIVTAMADECSA